MAELLIKIGSVSPDPRHYQDGDIVCAFNDRRIKCVHAEHLCHVRKSPRNGRGLIALDSLAQHFYETTHQYRFERISAKEVRRINLVTAQEVVFSDVPKVIDGKRQQMDVDLYVRRRLQKTGHCLFGGNALGAIWYGGRKDLSAAKIEAVWDGIEAKSGNQRTLAKLWPLGRLDIKHFFPVSVDDFDDQARMGLTASERVEGVEEGAARVLVQKRVNKIPYMDLAGLDGRTKDLILDKSQDVDWRGEALYERAAIIEAKA
jgi:hypothetical protein